MEHHIKDEQYKVFKSAEKALNSEEFQKIMKPFEQEKLEIKRERNHQDVREEKRSIGLCQGVFTLSTRR